MSTKKNLSNKTVYNGEFFSMYYGLTKLSLFINPTSERWI